MTAIKKSKYRVLCAIFGDGTGLESKRSNLSNLDINTRVIHRVCHLENFVSFISSRSWFCLKEIIGWC